MDKSTLPPYLTLAEASKYVYGDPEKEGFFFRMAQCGDFTLYWQVPHYITQYLITIEDGVLLAEAIEQELTGNRLAPLSPNQVDHLINEDQVSANLDIPLEGNGEHFIYLPNQFEYSLDMGMDVRDITYPVPDYVQMDLHPYLDAHSISPDELYIKREDAIAFKDGKPLKNLNKKANKAPAAKTVNEYLRLIYTLSSALIKGLTKEPYSDAEAITTSLDLAGYPPPIGPRTLGDYLKIATNLKEADERKKIAEEKRAARQKRAAKQ